MKFLLLLGIVILAACEKPRITGIRTIEENEAPLKPSILASDPLDEPQFVSGAYPAEPDGWRWTRGRFSFVLLAPENASANGAELNLLIDIPQVVLDRTGPVTLTASVQGHLLEPETRSRAGKAAYRRQIPPSALPRREVLIDVAFDKAVPPNTIPGEDRELAAAVHAAELRQIGQKAR